MLHRFTIGLGATLAAATLAACGGAGTTGGGSSNLGSGIPTNTVPGTPATNPPPPVATASMPAVATPQVVSVELPQNGIGQENDPTFGLVGGYSQTQKSQVLGFVPGAQIMIKNIDPALPHTLGDTGASSFPAGQPAALSPVPSGGTTFSHGFQSGNLNAGQMIGPITLSAGTYFIGCAYHYASNAMRDVLVVAANAKPGPQAGSTTPATAPATGAPPTQAPTQAPPPGTMY